jgi:hypothetical protein
MKFTLSNLLLGVAVVPVPPSNFAELPIQA